MKFKFNETKFRETVIYIAGKCAGDPTFDTIKLNKILYYADFAAYRQLGSPITGAEYRKYAEGPAPDCMVEQSRILVDAGDAAIEERVYFTGSPAPTGRRR